MLGTPKLRRTLAVIGAAAAVPLVLAGCTDNTKTTGAADGPIQVSSNANECKVSTGTAPSGNLTFAVKNEGTEVTEFYLLAEDGLRILGEVENIGPGITRNLVVTAPAGKYNTACKPGMQGEGIRASFEVTESGNKPSVDADFQKLLDTGSQQYVAYVKDQSEQLIVGTKAFADAFAAGDAAKARELYASTRMHWERIEPVAESFGDLDPKLDAREADLEPGQEWTGWHRAEKDLFPPAEYTAMTPAERTAISTQLVADTEDLVTRTRTVELTPDKLGNGAKELLDEVATGKVTGEEEIWSHTDLWDFQANVDGARIAFENLRPALEQKDPELAKSLDEKFTALQTELKTHAKGDGFVFYNELSQDQVQQLAALVDSLGEPLSKLTAAVVL
ncbi:PbrT family lead (Pb2+) uptake porter [Arthrobacter sp. MYb23]|uniref:iron uptake system protein EfeO n=1 Tax=unclassified Arthrobacter TaxID=235627 RepID=UPI000CFDB8AF|nr:MULTISPECIES: iron uptake system protein EfeO [unclassified Arthrobacter]PRB45122.1 PbrT family lead (Pb2+) uptake porter [Arthrobacter sp. MYb51]PRB99415.1 PbrT family lead (Pb2+) uptake porter [Arthrobacter sp. MYb23]